MPLLHVSSVTTCHMSTITFSVKFDDFEHVTCMKVVSLRSAETVSGKKHFIVLSTCDTKTEEVSSKGKVGGEVGRKGHPVALAMLQCCCLNW